MISHYYAIADAGGNIYPGTFRKTADQARWAHVVGDDKLTYPNTRCYPIDWIETQWPTYAERGDHVVYCRIETNENAVMTQIDGLVIKP